MVTAAPALTQRQCLPRCGLLHLFLGVHMPLLMVAAVTGRPFFLTGMLIQAQNAAHADLCLCTRHCVVQQRQLSESKEA